MAGAQGGRRELSGAAANLRRQCCGQRRQGVWRADRWLSIHATMLASSTASRRCRQRAQGKVQRAVEQQGAHRGSRRGAKAERHADVAAGRPAAAAGTRAGGKAGLQAFRRSAGALSDWMGPRCRRAGPRQAHTGAAHVAAVLCQAADRCHSPSPSRVAAQSTQLHQTPQVTASRAASPRTAAAAGS